MEKQVDTKIALGMVIGNITGVTFGVILALMFLNNVSEKNRDEILEYAELKGYQLYNFTDNSNNLNSNTYNTMIFKKNNIEN